MTVITAGLPLLYSPIVTLIFSFLPRFCERKFGCQGVMLVIFALAPVWEGVGERWMIFVPGLVLNLYLSKN